MKCPLMRIPITVKGVADREKIDDCIKEECAWWDKLCQSCSVYEISRSLMGIFDVLVDIKDKMPPDEQARPRP